MGSSFAFEKLTKSLRGAIESFPDKRTGDNLSYTMEDAGLGAFSVFFTQCPSFLAHQKAMAEAKGKSNAQTIFGLEKIPTDNHIRALLDPALPELGRFLMMLFKYWTRKAILMSLEYLMEICLCLLTVLGFSPQKIFIVTTVVKSPIRTDQILTIIV